MRVILARGPVVAALKRYDPGLRVRWSFEKKKWAIEHRAKRDNGIVPPVQFIRLGADEWQERLLSEFSERYISYHTGYYVVCWVKKLNWSVYNQVVSMDSQRIGDRDAVLKNFDRSVIAGEERRQIEEQKEAKDRSAEAFERLKFLNSRQPWGDPIGAGPI